MEKGWFQHITKEKEGIIVELFTYLRAIDRFFVIENLSLSDQDNPSRNFFEELLVVRDVILKIVNLIELLLPEDEKNSYWFGKYAEQRFMNTALRDGLREELYRQDSPEKGLLLLYDTFVNIKTIVSDLLKSQNIPYISFKNLGEIISREIRENRFFNPFQKPLGLEDKIENPVIAEIVKSIDDRVVKRYISLAIIILYRILRRLRYVVTDSPEQAVLNRGIAILFLIRSEFDELRRLLDSGASETQKRGLVEMSRLLTGLSYQVSMEMKRVYLQEMRDITKRSGQKGQRGRIENSAGIIRNFAQQVIIQISQYLRPDIKGEEIFPEFITKYQASVKLREDLAVMHGIVSAVIDAGGGSFLEALRNCIHYFQSFTSRLLRYDDYEEFSNFIDEILKYINNPETGQKPSLRFIERLNHFKIFLETLIRQVSQREELRGERIDEERIKTIIQNFL